MKMPVYSLSPSTTPVEIDCPRDGSSCEPWSTNSIPSVASRSGTFSRTISRPFNAPISRPAASAIGTTATVGQRPQHEPDRAQHHGEAGVGADREVEAADDHRDGHAERDDPDRRDRLQDRDDVVDRAERRLGDREVDRHAGEQREQAEAQDRAARRRAAAPTWIGAGCSVALMRSSPASAPRGRRSRRGTSRTTPPCESTTIRSATSSTSSTSAEATTTALSPPARAPWPRCRARAPRSTPRNGSSSASTRAGFSSQRPTTTFCWLPPESDSIGASGPGRRRRRGRGSPRSCACARPARG